VLPYRPICIACGAELGEQCDDPGLIACNRCFRESTEAYAAARERARNDEFRWISFEWFRTGYMERVPRGVR